MTRFRDKQIHDKDTETLTDGQTDRPPQRQRNRCRGDEERERKNLHTTQTNQKEAAFHANLMLILEKKRGLGNRYMYVLQEGLKKRLHSFSHTLPQILAS